jgi:hypothetical protein
MHPESIREQTNAYKVSLRKSKGMRPFGRTKLR